MSMPFFDDAELAALSFLVNTLNAGHGYVARSWLESHLEPLGAKGQTLAILRRFANLGIVKETVFDPLAGTSVEKSSLHCAFRQTRWEITGKAIEYLRQDVPPAPPAGANADEGTDGAKKPLPPSREKAYRLHEWAVKQNAALDGATDQAVYDWLKENLENPKELPNPDTFSRYLTEARGCYGTQKHSSRSGRAMGKSVVKRDQI